MAHAWNNMCRVGKGQEERRVNSKYFANARLAHSNACRLLVGSKNHFYGMHHTDISKSKISRANKGRLLGIPKEQYHKDKIAAAHKGKEKSPEHKRKLAGKTMVQHIVTLEIKKIPREDWGKEYPKDVWVHPKKITPEKKFKCDHCEMVTIKGNLNRWHNDNCKARKLK